MSISALINHDTDLITECDPSRKRKFDSLAADAEETVVRSLFMLGDKGKAPPPTFMPQPRSPEAHRTSSQARSTTPEIPDIAADEEEVPVTKRSKKPRISRSSKTATWNENFERLNSIIKQTGKFPSFQTKNVHVWRWLDAQCALHDANKLERSRIDLLEDLGFDFIKSEFKKSPKKCSKKRFPLSSWLHAQRTQKRKGKLPPHRLELLNKLGVNWEPSKGERQAESPESSDTDSSSSSDSSCPQAEMSLLASQREQIWMENYNKLKEFRKKYGHLRVPTDACAAKDYFTDSDDLL